MYNKEIVDQEAKIEGMEEKNADPHDIKAQREVLSESVKMLPDTTQRLKRAAEAQPVVLPIVEEPEPEDEEDGFF